MFLGILGILSCLVPKRVRLRGFIGGAEEWSGVAFFYFYFSLAEKGVKKKLVTWLFMGLSVDTCSLRGTRLLSEESMLFSLFELSSWTWFVTIGVCCFTVYKRFLTICFL